MILMMMPIASGAEVAMSMTKRKSNSVTNRTPREGNLLPGEHDT
jgi:hypothetical protein